MTLSTERQLYSVHRTLVSGDRDSKCHSAFISSIAPTSPSYTPLLHYTGTALSGAHTPEERPSTMLGGSMVLVICSFKLVKVPKSRTVS